jgi:hypothetical protein
METAPIESEIIPVFSRFVHDTALTARETSFSVPAKMRVNTRRIKPRKVRRPVNVPSIIDRAS